MTFPFGILRQSMNYFIIVGHMFCSPFLSISYQSVKLRTSVATKGEFEKSEFHVLSQRGRKCIVRPEGRFIDMSYESYSKFPHKSNEL